MKRQGKGERKNSQTKNLNFKYQEEVDYMKKIFANKQQANFYLQRVMLFCAYHKIETLAEFLKLTKGINEK